MQDKGAFQRAHENRVNHQPPLRDDPLSPQGRGVRVRGIEFIPATLTPALSLKGRGCITIVVSTGRISPPEERLRVREIEYILTTLTPALSLKGRGCITAVASGEGPYPGRVTSPYLT